MEFYKTEFLKGDCASCSFFFCSCILNYILGFVYVLF